MSAPNQSERARSRERILEILDGDDAFLMASHRRPDGDSLGTMLALAIWLRDRGRIADVVSEEGVPESHRFLPGAGSVSHEHPDDVAERVVIVVDTPDMDRAGAVLGALRDARILINIDHHPDNSFFGDINLVDPGACSAALLVYELLPSDELSPEIASALYVGIMTDTGGFRFSNTDARALMAASQLVLKGVEPSVLARRIYGDQPLGRLKLLGTVLASTETALGGKVAVSLVTDRMREDAGDSGDEIEGIASYGRLVRGVEVAVLLREQGSRVRASLRSNGRIDVNAVARRLGGGGHMAAAGVTLSGSVDSARLDVVAAIADEIETDALKRGTQ